MTLNPQPYSTYKPSGVLWLDELPAHWEVRPLKRLLVEPLKYGANEPGQYSDHTHPRYIRITDISEDGRLRDDSFRSLPKEIAEPYLLTGGDILFARSGATVGKTFQYRPNWGKAAHAGYLIRARFNKTAIEPDFIEYYTQSQIYRDWILGISIQATIQNVSAERYGGLRIPLPPPSEQRAIVRYLDYVDRRIRRYVTAKQKLIDLLEEEKQAIINQAVTRGLDPNVRLKPSGVEWLGDVPEHWEVRRLKTIAQIRYGLGQPPRELTNGKPLIRATNVSRGSITEKNLIYVDPTDLPTGRDALLSEREIIVVRSGAYTADSAIVPSKYSGAVTGYDMVVTVISEAPEFIAFALLSAYVRDDQLIVASMRAAQPHLNAEELGSSIVLLPPLAEQAAIVNHLDKATADIEATSARARRQIELIQEYRTRLIANVVTGKLDVREAAGELPDEDDDGQDPIFEESNPLLDGMGEDPQVPAARSFVEA